MNVFKAISGLAIIPTASSDKYRHRLKSPSGRQAGRQAALGEHVDGGSAINSLLEHLPSHATAAAARPVCLHVCTQRDPLPPNSLPEHTSSSRVMGKGGVEGGLFRGGKEK